MLPVFADEREDSGSLATTPRTLAEHRLLLAIEEVKAAARALGMDSDALYAASAPRSMRIEAWLWRTSKLLRRC